METNSQITSQLHKMDISKILLSVDYSVSPSLLVIKFYN